jgi:hypothetical protein
MKISCEMTVKRMGILEASVKMERMALIVKGR